MLLDVRTYTCRPGAIKKHLEIYEKYGKAPQTKHLGQPLAYMVTETGNPNQYIHIWVYESAGDREAKRAASGPTRTGSHTPSTARNSVVLWNSRTF